MEALGFMEALDLIVHTGILTDLIGMVIETIIIMVIMVVEISHIMPVDVALFRIIVQTEPLQ